MFFRFDDDPLWNENANLLTNAYRPPYYLYADYLISYLAEQAPNYAQPIQTQGFSTGAMLAMDIARRLNTGLPQEKLVALRQCIERIWINLLRICRQAFSFPIPHHLPCTTDS